MVITTSLTHYRALKAKGVAVQLVTKIENSYCVPRTVKEWDMLAPYFPEEVEDYGSVNAWRVDYIRCGYIHLIQVDGRLVLTQSIRDVRTEIPVTRFIDLLHDRICDWRLEEVGFEVVRDDLYDPYWQWRNNVGDNVDFMADSIWCNERHFNITTFTDLLTLIRMLTPPSNAH